MAKDVDFPEVLINPDLSGCLDTFKCLLLKECSNSLLPELISVFGPEVLPKFLGIFAGTTFKVPGRDQIERLARDARIYTQMVKCRQENTSITDVAREHALKLEYVYTIYDRVNLTLKEYNLDTP